MRALGLVLFSTALVLAGCPASLDDRCAEGACTARAGSGDGGAPVILPDGCTIGQQPKESLACVDDTVGVFVDATAGNDANPGTIGKPVQSLTAAVSLASAAKKPHIYACKGAYTSSIDLRSGISLFGGMACDFKSYTGDRPEWTAASPAYALRIAGVSTPVVIADFVVKAAPGKADGESSIGVFVSDTTNARLVRVDVTAADGKDGTNAVPLTTAAARPNKATQGGADLQPGGDGATNVCSTGTSTGGKGGKGGGADPATAGSPANAGTGIAGTYNDVNCAVGAGRGGNGATGKAGDAATAAKTYGALSPSGWTPQNGDDGKDGFPGQGGGGGGANTAGGGGGGAGGCGGKGGAGGGGGGASIAVVVLRSTVAIESCVLASGKGGRGGVGADGQPPQLGGFGGNAGSSPSNVSGCPGGTGGDGGKGGAGAGGAGGVAPALLRGEGAVVDMAGTTATPGTFGQGGIGGVAGTNDGPAAAPTADLKL